MTPIDPNKIHFTGENSFLRLKTDPKGEETTVCAHWRALITPGGPGTCLFLRSDATGGEVKLYADNIEMARWFQGLEALLNPPFADTSMPIAEATFAREGRFGAEYREIVDTADGRITLSWSDMGEPFQLRLPPNNDGGTGPWAVYSCLVPCKTAVLDVAGTRAAGTPFANEMAGHPSSSSCLAWSETWLREG